LKTEQSDKKCNFICFLGKMDHVMVLFLHINCEAKIFDNKYFETPYEIKHMTCKSLSPPDGRCPYWSTNDNEECGMSMGGVFIPLPHHVKIFCLTSQYIQCHQYIKGCEYIRMQEENRKKGEVITDERRKSRRFSEQLQLILAVCDTKIKPPAFTSFKSMTIDVSLGGMRLECPQKLATGSIVGFELDGDFSSHNISGVGEVKWSKPQQDTDKYEFGIAFPDFNAIHGMREYLSLKRKKNQEGWIAG